MATPLRELFVQFFAEFDFEGFDQANQQTDELKGSLGETGESLGQTGEAASGFSETLSNMLTRFGLSSEAASGLIASLGPMAAVIGGIIAAVVAVIAVLGALVTAFVALAGVIRDTIQWIVQFTTEMAQSGTELGNLADRIGTTVTVLQGFSAAAIEAGADAQSMTSALTDLGSHVGDALANPASETARTFRRLGVDIRDSAGNARPIEDVFLDVADAIGSTTDAATRIRLANQLMGDSGRRLIPLFEQGSDTIREYRDSIGEIQPELEEYVANSRRLTREQARLDLAWQGARQILFNFLAPAVIAVVERLVEFNEWLNRNQGLINALKVAFISLGITVIAFTLTIGALIAVIVTALAVVFWPLTVVLAAIAAAFVLTVGQVAVAVLAFQDFYTFLEGGNSVFEQFLNWLYEITNGAIPAMIASLLSADGPIGSFLDRLSSATNVVISLYNAIARLGGLDIVPNVDFRNSLEDAASAATASTTREGFVEGIRSSIANAVGVNTEFTAADRAASRADRPAESGGMLGGIRGFLPLVPTSTVSAADTARSRSSGPPAVVTQNLDVSIEGVRDPNEVRRVVEDLLADQNREIVDILSPAENE